MESPGRRVVHSTFAVLISSDFAAPTFRMREVMDMG
jgi:hypothetical protein